MRHASVAGRLGVVAAVVGAGVAASPGAAAGQPTFLALTPAHSQSHAQGLSADGSVVVGQRSAGVGFEGFRWTLETGMVAVQDLAGGDVRGWAFGVSGDGQTVVGLGHDSTGQHAVRWPDPATPQSISDGGGVGDAAYAASMDGAVIAGRMTTPQGARAFRWTAEGGMVPLGGPQGVPYGSTALAISRDGSVVVGAHWFEDEMDYRGFRWTAATGIQTLADLPGGIEFTSAHGVSRDGQIVVGGGVSEEGAVAVMWLDPQDPISLGRLPGVASGGAQASAVSADGSVVVGTVDSEAVSGVEAFIWTPGEGMRLLRDVLIDLGVTGLEGWLLTSAAAISDDGRTITGTAWDPDHVSRAYLVTIPGPGSGVAAAFALVAGLARRRRPRW